MYARFTHKCVKIRHVPRDPTKLTEARISVFSGAVLQLSWPRRPHADEEQGILVYFPEVGSEAIPAFPFLAATGLIPGTLDDLIDLSMSVPDDSSEAAQLAGLKIAASSAKSYDSEGQVAALLEFGATYRQLTTHRVAVPQLSNIWDGLWWLGFPSQS